MELPQRYNKTRKRVLEQQIVETKRQNNMETDARHRDNIQREYKSKKNYTQRRIRTEHNRGDRSGQTISKILTKEQLAQIRDSVIQAMHT